MIDDRPLAVALLGCTYILDEYDCVEEYDEMFLDDEEATLW